MMSVIVQLLIILIIAGLLLYAAQNLPLPHPVPLLIQILVALLIVIWLAQLVLPPRWWASGPVVP